MDDAQAGSFVLRLCVLPCDEERRGSRCCVSILMHKRACFHDDNRVEAAGQKEMQPGGQHPRTDQREGQGRDHDGTIQPS